MYLESRIPVGERLGHCQYRMRVDVTYNYSMAFTGAYFHKSTRATLRNVGGFSY